MRFCTTNSTSEVGAQTFEPELEAPESTHATTLQFIQAWHMETTEGHQRKAEETAASDAWVAMPYLAACT